MYFSVIDGLRSTVLCLGITAFDAGVGTARLTKSGRHRISHGLGGHRRSGGRPRDNQLGAAALARRGHHRICSALQVRG